MIPSSLFLPFAALVASVQVQATPIYTPSTPPPATFGVLSEREGGLKAPLHSLAVDSGVEAVEDGYIVVLKPTADLALLTSHLALVQSSHEADPFAAALAQEDAFSGTKNVYVSPHLVGYAGTFSPELVDLIRQDPMVDFVERDSIVKTQETEIGAPWGLARVSHRETLRLSTFTKYEYDSVAGEGVDVYVVDTGINVDHVEFEGRASWGKTIPKNDVDKDGNGHGTHCAGTIASRKYGVAKKAHVIAVKVLGSNGSGSMSDVVDGVLYAAESAAKKASAAAAELLSTGKTSHKGSVASMSLGGGKSPALDKAVNAAVDSGLHFAVAAGNDNRDACDYSPASADKAITVGASTLGDERAYFSNFGKCVDIFGPGLNILSTWNTNNVSTNTISGTSMATPHIAGLTAYLLSLYGSPSFNPSLIDPTLDASAFSAQTPLLQKAMSLLPSYVAAFIPQIIRSAVVAPTPKVPTLTPAKLKKAILALATVDALSGELPAGTPNLLAFNNYTLKG
ncbi:peptidase S8/S53 domain-containing protein [Mrakia frigida]|uniref:S8 family peptidase n=1 Tax=Mrakia frigida TaxID=29902 RepID=UPI003FCC264F